MTSEREAAERYIKGWLKASCYLGRTLLDKNDVFEAICYALRRDRGRIKDTVRECMPPEGMCWSDWIMEVVDGKR